jgi:hypothetical protein
MANRKAADHIAEMRHAAAAVDPDTMIGLCEGGFPITAERCQICGATYETKCGRADRGPSGSIRAGSRP